MTAARLPVSVCLIAGNEAARIRRALTSVSGWAAEIVVVLNEDVNDGTDQIAAEYGAKVYREKWQGFGPQKNSAAAKCTQPWLLNLDADEEVTPGLAEEIRRVVTGAPALAAYRFPRLTQFCGRWISHGDWYPDYQTRLWQRGQAQWSADAVHEKLVVAGPVGRLEGELRHYLADTIDRQIAKISSYTEGLARAARARGKQSGIAEMLFRPAWRFFRSYILRLGMLDGWQGVYIAWMTAFYTATRYAKICAAPAEPPAPR